MPVEARGRFFVPPYFSGELQKSGDEMSVGQRESQNLIYGGKRTGMGSEQCTRKKALNQGVSTLSSYQ